MLRRGWGKNLEKLSGKGGGFVAFINDKWQIEKVMRRSINAKVRTVATTVRIWDEGQDRPNWDEANTVRIEMRAKTVQIGTRAKTVRIGMMRERMEFAASLLERLKVVMMRSGPWKGWSPPSSCGGDKYKRSYA
jgi:hypothetical protein